MSRLFQLPSPFLSGMDLRRIVREGTMAKRTGRSPVQPVSSRLRLALKNSMLRSSFSAIHVRAGCVTEGRTTTRRCGIGMSGKRRGGSLLLVFPVSNEPLQPQKTELAKLASALLSLHPPLLPPRARLPVFSRRE